MRNLNRCRSSNAAKAPIRSWDRCSQLTSSNSIRYKLSRCLITRLISKSIINKYWSLQTKSSSRTSNCCLLSLIKCKQSSHHSPPLRPSSPSPNSQTREANNYNSNTQVIFNTKPETLLPPCSLLLPNPTWTLTQRTHHSSTLPTTHPFTTSRPHLSKINSWHSYKHNKATKWMRLRE